MLLKFNYFSNKISLAVQKLKNCFIFKKLIKLRPRIKRFGLQITPGERIRDELIKAGIKAAEESGWAAGNITEKLVQVADKVGSTIDFGAKLIGGSEAGRALGRLGRIA